MKQVKKKITCILLLCVLQIRGTMYVDNRNNIYETMVKKTKFLYLIKINSKLTSKEINYVHHIF